LVKYCNFWIFPFIFSTIELSITDAFFESMSGITTTGSTIISNLEFTPKGILLWRAILQWLGWNWYYCYGNNFNANNECWWNAII